MANNRQPTVWRSLKVLPPARSIRFLQANLRCGQPGIMAGYTLVKTTWRR